MSFSHAGREVQVRLLNKKWAQVKIPKIRWLKFRKTRDVPEDVREVTVSKTALGWNVTFGCVVPDREDTIPGCVGIDRGVDIPLALSDARVFGDDLKLRLEHLEQRARFLQRRVSRRKKGSNRYRRAVKQLSRIKAKIARVRKHWAHCVTSWITQSYGTVVIEDLKTKNMTRSNRGTIEAPGRNVRQNSGRNRAILNIGWHQIEQMLSYKAGRLVKVDPRYTSQTCSTCGTQDKTSRKSQAVFECTNCGFHGNADINAAINILMRGNTACSDVESICPDVLKRLLDGANRPRKILVLWGEEDVKV
jgi:putative transposase